MIEVQPYRLRRPIYARRLGEDEAQTAAPGDYLLPCLDNCGSARDVVIPRSQFERWFELDG